jgi:hypothetical protein
MSRGLRAGGAHEPIDSTPGDRKRLRRAGPRGCWPTGRGRQRPGNCSGWGGAWPDIHHTALRARPGLWLRGDYRLSHHRHRRWGWQRIEWLLGLLNRRDRQWHRLGLGKFSQDIGWDGIEAAAWHLWHNRPCFGLAPRFACRAGIAQPHQHYPQLVHCDDGNGQK